jgi:hypothetical protein
MRARIYQPARTATQSGNARSQHWVLEYAPASRREVDPLMGWTSSDDTQSQVRLTFDTKDPRGYGENFATDRRGAWTH